MKRVVFVSIPVLLLIGGIVVFVYTFAENMDTKSSTPDLENNYLYDSVPELRITDLHRFWQTKSVSIDNNEDPGFDPPDDYLGILGNLSYPLKDLEITDADEVVMIIRPSINAKLDKVDAYMACNTEVVKQVNDELCYFFTPPGTTPVFYVSIYQNGFVIKKDVGILGIYLSKLGDEFKPVMRTNAEDPSAIACISHVDEQSKEITNEFLCLVNPE